MSLVDILLTEYRASNGHKLDKHVLRDKSLYGFLKASREDSESLIGSANDPNSARSQIERLHQDRDKAIVVTTDYGITKQATRSCTITCATESATKVAVTFTPIVYDICLDMREFPNLSQESWKYEKGFQEMFMGKLMKVEEAMRADKDALCRDALLAAKTPTTAFQDPILDVTGDALRIPKAQELDAFNQIEQQFALNDFNTQAGVYVIAQNRGLAQFRRQTQGNIQFNGGELVEGNEFWQYGNILMNFTNQLANVAGTDYRGIAFVPDAIGIFESLPVQMREEIELASSPIFLGGEGFGNFELPVYGEKVGYYKKYACNGGDSYSMQWQLSTNFATITSYNDDPVNEPAPIIEFQQLSA